MYKAPLNVVDDMSKLDIGVQSDMSFATRSLWHKTIFGVVLCRRIH